MKAQSIKTWKEKRYFWSLISSRHLAVLLRKIIIAMLSGRERDKDGESVESKKDQLWWRQTNQW